MKNIILITLSFIVALSLAENKTETKSLEENNSAIEELIYNDDNLKNSDSLQKRDSGYSYPKPSRIKFRGRFIPNGSTKNRVKFSRLNAPARPFETYGPPRQTSLHFSINNHSSRRPSLHQNKNTLHSSVQGIRFPSSNLPASNSPLEVPSPIREVDFVEPSPIASQNEEPFKMNSANYLPPKNQRLPVHQISTLFQPTSPSLNSNQLIHSNNGVNINDNGHQNLINQQQHQPHISDAVQFLIQNSQAISNLYDTPASNINFAPVEENDQSIGNEVQNFNNNFLKQNEELSNIQTLQRSFPSYASGTLEPFRSLEQIQSLEKDRLIAELQQELVQRQVQDPSRYVQHGEGGNQKYLSVESSQLDNSASVLNLQGVVPFGTKIKHSGGHLQSSIKHNSNSLTYGLPTVTTTPQTTSSTAISNASVDRPQSSREGSSHGGTLVPTSSKPPMVFPFPQYGGFIPTLIAGTNFASIPSYGSTFVGSNSFHSLGQVIESSPTHFDVPIPTVATNKPSSAGSPLTPTTPKPTDSLGSSSSLLPVTPLRPFVPVLPTVTQVQTPLNTPHPSYNHPTVVNSLFFKPVKPVYPVYYYPNVQYQLQKPQYILPWNYAPAFKSSQQT